MISRQGESRTELEGNARLAVCRLIVCLFVLTVLAVEVLVPHLNIIKLLSNE